MYDTQSAIPHLYATITKDGDDDDGSPAVASKPVQSLPIPLPSISCIGIRTNLRRTVISYTETTMGEAEDPKSSAICKHGAGTSVQQ